MTDPPVAPPFVSRPEKATLCVLVIALALAWNWQFLDSCDLPTLLRMNDIANILAGYYHTPHLLTDGLRWWHGTWIQEGISAYRPLSAYLYWIESWVGLHWGFVWTGWIGFALFVLNCLLTAALAWRLTQSKVCMAVAAIMAAGLRFGNVGQQPLWLAWYPGHQELFMHALLLGALLNFDLWQERAERKYLIGSWLCFSAGCLAKEHVYIFPLFALAVVVTRRQRAQVPWRQGVRQAALMLAAVLSLWFYRAAVLTHPRNEHLIPIQVVRKSLLFMYTAPGRYLITEEPWFPGFALLVFCLGLATVKLHAGQFAPDDRRRWLTRSYVWLPLCLAVVALYLALAGKPFMEAIWYIVDRPWQEAHGRDFIDMEVTCGCTYLLWKYRRQETTAVAWLLLYISYWPVLGYIGWHYTISGTLFRAVYSAMCLKLLWLECGRPMPRRRPVLNSVAALRAGAA